MKFKILLLFLFSPLFGALPQVSEMSLKEKVGQLLMVHFQGSVANEDASFLINELKVGAFIYYNWANGLGDPSQVQNLSSALQAMSKIPLLIAIDQEGGPVTRLKEGFTQSPSQFELTKLPIETTYSTAKCVANELKSVGINMNLAPVVDLACNTCSSIGVRSFGADVETVCSYAKVYLQSYSEVGVATTLKHFPGYGGVVIDAHVDLPILDRTQEQMWNYELLPYLQLAKWAPCIMTGHLIVPSFDKDNVATLSPYLLEVVLRQQIGFEGVILSDSLIMEGLLKNCNSVSSAAIRAINAGCDMLILGGKQLIGQHQNFELSVQDMEMIAKAICNAVKEGAISENRLDSAVTRVLKLKEKLNL